jgi:hypothetical protein
MKGINGSPRRKLENANTTLLQLALCDRLLFNSLHPEVFKDGGDGKLYKKVETNKNHDTNSDTKLANIKLYIGARSAVSKNTYTNMTS